MKRPVKGVLLLSAAGIAFLGVFVGQAFVRAHRILEANLEEARKILETFPAETTHRPPIFDPPEPGNAWDLEDEALRKIDPYGSLEKDPPSAQRLGGLVGKTFHLDEPEEVAQKVASAEPQFDLLRHALCRTELVPSRRPGAFTTLSARNATGLLLKSARHERAQGRDVSAIERLVLAMGWAQDPARHGDREHLDLLQSVERDACGVGKEILAHHSLSVGDLKRAGRWLDRLSQARPSVVQTLRVDAAVERRLITDREFVGAVYASEGLWAKPPSWRDLWSSTIHDAKQVLALARAARALQGLDLLPPWSREGAARHILETLDLSSCQAWEGPDAGLLELDAAALTELALFRVGIALAEYEAEKGAFPPDLPALVPRYLPSVPPCPWNGRPFKYESGRLWFEALPIDAVSGQSAPLLFEEVVNWRIRGATP